MQSHVEIKSNNLILRGYLHMPEDRAYEVPLVCMFHGFTGNKMEDHFYYVRLSRQLEKEGIASLRMDFGNSGESDGTFKDMTPEGEIVDARNIIEFAKTIPGIDKNSIGLVGFSMGGMVAAIAAAEKKQDIKCLALISPAANLKHIFSGFFQHNNEVADIGGLIFSQKAYEEMKTINPLERAKGFDKEVIIVQGTEDTTVPVEVSALYENIYGQNVSYHYVKDSNHIYGNRGWEEEMRNVVVKFLKEKIILIG